MYLSEMISERAMEAEHRMLQRESALERLYVHLVFKKQLYCRGEIKHTV